MPALYRFNLGDVTVDDFIAYTPFYKTNVSWTKRKPFYVGKVIALKDTAVQVQTYITGTKGLSLLNTSRPVKYKTYLGPQNVQDVAAEDIITVCELSPSNALKAASKRKIHLLLDEEVLDAMRPFKPAAGQKEKTREEKKTTARHLSGNEAQVLHPAMPSDEAALEKTKDAAPANKATVPRNTNNPTMISETKEHCPDATVPIVKKEPIFNPKR